MDNKQEFLNLCKLIKRDGIDGLISYLEQSDFFVAPASTKYHGSYPGGLLDHSLQVYHEFERLKSIYPEVANNLSKETEVIITLFNYRNYILSKYLKNKLTKAIICGGLEPFDSFSALYNLIKITRDNYHCSDTIVIYTGYNKEEIQDKIHLLKPFGNIVCKFGRYVPNGQKHFDQTLGVDLASSNQYAEVIS